MTVILNTTRSTEYITGRLACLLYSNNFEYTDVVILPNTDNKKEALKNIKKSIFNTSSKALAKFLEEEKKHGDLF